MRGGRGVPAQLFLRRAKTEARRVLVDDQTSDALGLLFACADHDDIDVVVTSTRDELLRAVQHIMIAIKPRAGFERRRVRTATGLRQAIAGDFIHRDQIRQIACLQLGIAKAINHPCSHIVNGNEGAGRGAAIGHRLHDQRGFQATKASAARFFGHVNGTKAKLSSGLPHIYRIMRLFVPFCRKRRDRISGEFTRHILDGDLIVGEFKLVLHAAAVALRFSVIQPLA